MIQSSSTNPLPLTTSLIAGDLNGDAKVSLADAAAFQQALSDAQLFAAEHPGVDLQAVGDTNGDGAVNFGDLAAFAALVLEAAASASAASEGDLNGDGLVTPEDAPAFGMALADAPGFTGRYPTVDREAAADLNKDGLVNFGDLQSFVSKVTAQGGAVTPGTVPVSDAASRLTFADLRTFVASLTGEEGGGENSAGGTSRARMDRNGDGRVDFGDLSALVELLLQ